MHWNANGSLPLERSLSRLDSYYHKTLFLCFKSYLSIEIGLKSLVL